MSEKRWLLGLVIAGLGCSSTAANWSSAGGPAATEAQIYETVVRYVTRHYAPGGNTTGPAAFCLAVGRRSAQAFGQSRRDPGETWVASRQLLGRMADLDPPIVPASDCAWNESAEEIHVASGERAVLLTVDHPTFSSSVRASTAVRTRENASYGFRHLCELALESSGWMVRRCL